MFKGFIYCITCLTNGKMYIGQTSKTIEKRYKTHLMRVRQGVDYALYRAIRKHGTRNFRIFEVMWVETNDIKTLKNKLNYLEIYFIKRFQTIKCGYNMTEGGDGQLGNKWSEEAKMRMSRQRKGKKFTKIHRQHIAMGKKGKKMPSSVKEALQRANVGRKLTNEHKMKISLALKGVKAPQRGRQLSEERKLVLSKMFSKEHNPFYGKKHSEETRLEMKKAWEIRKNKLKL